MTLAIGTQIGDYRLLSRVGKGAYGIVFEAEHTITQRVDALKVMLDAACPEDDEQRFLREIRVQARLQHPNIATAYHAFQSSYGLVLVMELVRGESLRAILDRGRPPLAVGLRYVLETLAGLDYAEQMGVIHRDIKPENILITPDGGVKLTDFGLAHVMNRPRITGSNESLGTPSYMSPEQVDGMGEVDARTDVYSTGVVLYEIATGRLPFVGTNGFAVMRAHREMQPAPPVKLEPAIGERLNAVILKALEKEPAKRFQSSAAFRAALQEAAEQVHTAAPSRGFHRQRVAAGVIVGIGICGATLSAGYWTFRQRPEAPAIAKESPPPAAPAAVAVPVVTQAPPDPVKTVSRNRPARAKARRKPSSPPATLTLTPPAPSPPPDDPEIQASSPQPSNPETAAEKPKKRHVLIRAFGRIFGAK